MRERLRAMFAAALRQLDVGDAMRAAVQRDGDVLTTCGGTHDLRRVRSVFVIAIGKAARAMAAAVLPLLHGAHVRGVLVPPRGDDGGDGGGGDSAGQGVPPLELLPGGHPIPDAGSVHAAERTLALLGDAGERDLVLFLLSGGGSALFERPSPDVPLHELQALYRHLLGCGADIVAVNTVRAHLSSVKGGRLAVRAGAARQTTLLLSDVPPDRPEIVASGPTLFRSEDADGPELAVALDACGLRGRLPPSYARLVRERRLPRLPRADHPAFARASSCVVLDQQHAVAALERAARDDGFYCERLATDDAWSCERLGDAMLRALDDAAAHAAGAPCAVVAGGELSVPLPADHGTGGRNQQFALHLAQRIQALPIALLSAGTDGRDGSAPAAGAVVDGTTIARALAAGLDATAAEARCDAHPFFAALGDLVEAAPGNNLRDLRILVHAP